MIFMGKEQKPEIDFMDGDPRSVAGFKAAVESGIAVERHPLESAFMTASFTPGVEVQVTMAEGKPVAIAAASSSPDAALEALQTMRDVFGK